MKTLFLVLILVSVVANSWCSAFVTPSPATAVPKQVGPHSRAHELRIASTTLLQQRHSHLVVKSSGNDNDDNSNVRDESGYRNKLYGVNPERGGVLLTFVLMICVWQFSIPVEFRRARFCSEEQVFFYPDSKCITPQNWANGIVEYYQNGGGIEFDFSIEGRE